MAKVKKMAFGGRSFGGPKPAAGPKPGMGIPNYAKPYTQQQGGIPNNGMGAAGQQVPKQLPVPPGAIFPQQVTPEQARLMEAQREKNRTTYSPNPNMAKAIPDYAKPYMAQAGQSTTPPTVRSLAGMGAFMKKGGAVKTKKYAKGGDVQSESSKLDQKNAEMDKAQDEGYKRYQAEQAKEAKANADSRKSMPSFGFGKPEKKAKGGSVKSSASSRADGIATKGKTRGRMV